MAKKKVKNKYPKTRGPGRPAHGTEPIKVSEYEEIASLYGKGWSHARLAEKYAVNIKCIANIFRRYILPAQRIRCSDPRQEQLLKIDVLFTIAWEQFYSSAPFETKEQIKEEIAKGGARGTASKELVEVITSRIKRPHQKYWLDIVMECIKESNKIKGVYAPEKMEHTIGEEYRVAGRTPAATNDVMMQRLMDKVEERRQYEKDLKALGVNLTPSDN